MRFRNLVMFSVVMAFVGLAYLAAPARAAAPTNQEAVVLFQGWVVVNGTFVTGPVKIVHDEEAMAKGEPCTRIYQVVEGKTGELLVAVHCKRVARPIAEQFTLGLKTAEPSYRVLTSYQFKGADHAHSIVDAR
jgi:hypothetical protein